MVGMEVGYGGYGGRIWYGMEVGMVNIEVGYGMVWRSGMVGMEVGYGGYGGWVWRG
jgi:hypothetical protein